MVTQLQQRRHGQLYARFWPASGMPGTGLSLAPHIAALEYPWLLSDVNHEPLVGRCTLHVLILGMNPGARILLDRIQTIIRPPRIVVEEDQVFDLRGHG